MLRRLFRKQSCLGFIRNKIKENLYILLTFTSSVKTYDVSTGHLILEHNYPRPKPGKGQSTEAESGIYSASVDINALLDTVKSEELCVGAWLNVLGYVRHRHQPRQQQQQQKKHKQQQHLTSSKKNQTDAKPISVYVDAVMIFSAGPVEIGEYERILRDSQDVDRSLGRLC